MLDERLLGTVVSARREACAAFIAKLEDKGEVGFAAELHNAGDDSDLICELIRARIIAPTDETTGSRIRLTVGWNSVKGAFNGLLPEYWDLVSLLPSRERAVRRTLRSIMEEQYGDNEQLLDAGCGTGLMAKLLVDLDYQGDIFGYDTNSAWRAFAAGRGIETFKTKDRDITTINEREAFNGIVCYMVLHHVPNEHDWKEALRQFFAALKPNGVLAYTDVVSAVNLGEERLPINAPAQTVPLQSGQLLHIPPVRMATRKHLKPHPDDARLEKFRNWKEVAQTLSWAGFAIESMDVVDDVTVHFKCRKPELRIWTQFSSRDDSQRESLRVLESLARVDVDVLKKRSPYQFTLPVMAALWHDLMGSGSAYQDGRFPWWRTEVPEGTNESPIGGDKETAPTETHSVNLNPSSPRTLDDDVDVRAIAFFSWESDSRQFLVRRAWPHHFHIISYSSVFAGWGSLGRMVEEFEADPKRYIQNTGYSFLDRYDVQRTLPFAGDFESLKYEAALAIPVADDADSDYPKLLGAYLVYLRRKELVPVHTGSDHHQALNRRLRELARKTAAILQTQERAFRYSEEESREQATAKEWRKLADSAEGSNLVIAELELTIDGGGPTEHSQSTRLLDVLCAGLMAMLSGPDTWTVRDGDTASSLMMTRRKEDPNDSSHTVCLLVAARPGMQYETLRERILGLIGPAGQKHTVRGLSFRCNRLGSVATG